VVTVDDVVGRVAGAEEVEELKAEAAAQVDGVGACGDAVGADGEAGEDAANCDGGRFGRAEVGYGDLKAVQGGRRGGGEVKGEAEALVGQYVDAGCGAGARGNDEACGEAAAWGGLNLEVESGEVFSGWDAVKDYVEGDGRAGGDGYAGIDGAEGAGAVAGGVHIDGSVVAREAIGYGVVGREDTVPGLPQESKGSQEQKSDY
jgi:hypothetical protein